MRTRMVACYSVAVFALACLSGCSKTEDESKHESSPGSNGGGSKMLDNEEASRRAAEVSTTRSQLYLRDLSIKQYHVGQSSPVTYFGRQLSKISFDYRVLHTGELSLQRVEVSLNNGSVETHTPFKVMSVSFGVGGGMAQKPVEIVQRIHGSNPRSPAADIALQVDDAPRPD